VTSVLTPRFWKCGSGCGVFSGTSTRKRLWGHLGLVTTDLGKGSGAPEETDWVLREASFSWVEIRSLM
jgi:hypothetical protein